MKRVWIAVAFLCLSIGLCTIEQLYIKMVFDDLSSIIAQMQEYESYEELSASVTEIRQYWDKHNDVLFALTDSDTVNELGQAIINLDPKSEDFNESLSELKTVNRFFYRNQRITPANIF